MFSLLSICFIVVLAVVTGTPSHAIHLHISGQLTSDDLERRIALSGSIGDSQNLVYLTNISLNDAPFSVMIDTGSSDLWVSSPVPNAVSENYQTSVSYASGSAAGNVMSATLDFAGSSIESQFFIEAPQGNAAAGADGLIGLGPSSSSGIRVLGNSSAANPPLDRIFTSDDSVSPLIAILLQRSDDPDEPYPGDLAVGEVLPQYQDILNQPRHPVTLAPLAGGQHWQTLLDVNGIIGPNGKPIQIKTQVTGAQTQNATVIFDTGFSLPQVPPYVAQALYGDIPGAVLANVSDLGEIWVLQCNQAVQATFLFAGVEFPIHPLDLNFNGFDLQADGKPFCVGAFQPYSFDIEEDSDILFDMVLGMGFLRNAYMLINFGNLVDATAPSTDTAYIQLLPITNATQAAQDFAHVRDVAGGATAEDIAKIFTSSASSSSSSDQRSTFSMPRWMIGAIATAGLVVILLIAAIVACCRRRRAKKAVGPGAWAANPPSYRPIYEPSPQAAYDIHMAPGPLPGYTPASVPEYRTAWDAHY